MHAAVVELDTLADTVRASAEDHDFRLVLIYRVIVRCVVCRVVICAVLCSADVDAVPCLADAELFTAVPDVILGDLKDLAQILVGEAVFLGLDQQVVCRDRTLVGHEGFLFLDEFLHLLNEILLDLCELVDLIDRNTLTQCLIHEEMALAGSSVELSQQLFLCKLVKSVHVTETVAALLE